MNWESRAACKLVDQNIFFPPSEAAEGESVIRARKYCDDCRVKKECVMFSIAPGEPVKPGIWGGMTTMERKRLRRMLTSVG